MGEWGYIKGLLFLYFVKSCSEWSSEWQSDSDKDMLLIALLPPQHMMLLYMNGTSMTHTNSTTDYQNTCSCDTLRVYLVNPVRPISCSYNGDILESIHTIYLGE